MRLLMVFFLCLVAFGCSDNNSTPKPNVNAANTAAAKPTALPVYGYDIIKTYPHDPKAFTQGLIYHDGFLYESTGQEGKSSLRKVELETGKVLQKFDLPSDDFGEGITIINGKIYQLTWRGGLCRVFDAKTLKLVKELSYQGEGWGLTTDGSALYMSQGTHVLKVLDSETFKQAQTIPVMREDGKPLMQINELEWVKGEIWANVWHSESPEILGKPNYIARIEPATGKLLGWINLAGISPDDQAQANDPYDPKAENTLNGIAYDPIKDRIFVTGKNWKNLYEIKLKNP
ncbi:MAG: glutaminyl-peptide cyclotransferase [Chloracidobacterium sp.]|nr:glutaminyl-peptide cyclotransferase [Chloracidobacterium sp.]